MSKERPELLKDPCAYGYHDWRLKRVRSYDTTPNVFVTARCQRCRVERTVMMVT